jgi:hypothetical protein
VTIGEMCEVIADSEIITKPDGTHPTAKQVFNYSPTGELFMIWDWYEQAKCVVNAKTKPVTMEMCEVIAAEKFTLKDGTIPTAQEIFDYTVKPGQIEKNGVPIMDPNEMEYERSLHLWELYEKALWVRKQKEKCDSQ